MKEGDCVVIDTTCICYAPQETVGESGFITEILPKPYQNKVMVRFIEPFHGHNTWIYDLSELSYDEGSKSFTPKYALK